ncbi:hypothetical protein IDJ75_15575 [Mucilaginibacter rigui]|uniref:Uncharacterized protein n=1 Tax=Mucilaginibacter rigui TaxID=534635 RepID=A0ABR7X800_9SPHI|nr:hypothetical protein [Mucilaginibacter rigui]MBD1386703.1 hypothetical protein [Mucilaginibacter rigui]
MEDKDRLEQISRAANNQQQVTTGAHVMIVTVEANVDEKTFIGYINKAAIARQTERKNLKPLEQFVNSMLGNTAYNLHITWTKNQASIAIGPCYLC